MKRLLIVGSGAREHALGWKLAQSPEVGEIYVAPGNAGTEAVGQNVPIAANDIAGLVRFAGEKNIDLTIVGPEAPLALGLADALIAAGRRVVGPTAAAARIESSKSFAKDLMRRACVPTAWYRLFDQPDDARRFVADTDYPLVIKADGLASGKGVVICATREEAFRAIDDIMVSRVHGQAGDRIVIEEFLTGPEVSLMALVDGRRCFPLPLSQDHKRLLDGDAGPNTGGMGAYAPAPFLIAAEAGDTADLVGAYCIRPPSPDAPPVPRPASNVLPPSPHNHVARTSASVPSSEGGSYLPSPLEGEGPGVRGHGRDGVAHYTDQLIQPIVNLLSEMHTPYRGILYAGLVLTPDGPKVLEYNCRLGDPETQVLMPLIDGDLLPYLEAIAAGSLDAGPRVLPRHAVGVVLAAPGYPDNPQTGSVIHGLDHVPEDLLVFHAGTTRKDEAARADAETGRAGPPVSGRPSVPDDDVVTSGGRVLTLVGVGDDLPQALERAYRFPIWFDRMQFRTDIAWQAKAFYARQPSPDLVPA